MRREILLIGNFFVSTGGRQVCQDLADHLRDLGWSVHTTSAHQPRGRRLLDMLWTVWRVRRRYAVALIDVFSGPSFVWAALCARLLHWLGKPYLLALRGGNLPQYAQRHPGRVRRLLGQASAVTTPSRYLQQALAPYRPDMILLPNPIELRHYPFIQRTAPRPRLVWLRAFMAHYNPCLAADVVAALREDYPDIRLIMIGPDKRDGTWHAFHQQVQALALANHVEQPGAIPKGAVPAWLQRGDIFLNTTNVDNTPVSVLEALACGLVVISTDVGGMPYLLSHEHDALLVPPQDPTRMAEAVRRVIEAPALAAQLSWNGRRTAEAFDWQSVRAQWDHLLTEVQGKTA
ncbi:MAG: glycosyltransferase family 4 protein [Anaerolineae bacterium]|nr:glycosyltransferase family 4 protein [Anaerolineae bacterium]